VPLAGSSLASEVSAEETLTWDLGYTLGHAWFQTGGGGDVYTGGTLTSLLPGSASPRLFNLLGEGGYPGIVTHGSDTPLPGYDFDTMVEGDGRTLVSPTNWLVHDTQPFWKRWEPYTIFWRRFGGTPIVDYDGTAIALQQPPSRPRPYVVKGVMNTQGNWVVPDGEKLIFLVDGTLTLKGTVTEEGTGMAIFVVNGDITVDPSVGVASTSDTPVLEGIYIAKGTFHTGRSTNPGTERFVGHGTFVASSFNLERDLGDANTTTASELFLWDPKVLVHLPKEMTDLNYLWQEVAP